MSLNQLILTINQYQKIGILLKLKDGRLCVYTDNERIIRIYNINYTLSYLINKIKSQINSMIQSNEGKLICSSYEITILQLNKNDYEIIQILKIWTNKIIEVYDNNLIALQNNYIRFYSNSNNKYTLEDEYKFEENVNNLIKIKDNELCLILDNYNKKLSINIFNIESKKIIKKLINVIYEIKCKDSGEMVLVENKYLIVSLYLYLILIDIDEYKIIHEIKTCFGCVLTFCLWNDYKFFSGDEIGDIIEWKISKNKILKIKEYNNGKKAVKSIIKINNNLIAAGSYDGFIKFYDISE